MKKHRNPWSPRQLKALRIANKMALRIYHHSKEYGGTVPVPKRTPKLIKKYLRFILRTNGVKWKIAD